jgi:hypothetical protein
MHDRVSFPFRIDHSSHMLACGAGRTQIGAAVPAPRLKNLEKGSEFTRIALSYSARLR